MPSSQRRSSPASVAGKADAEQAASPLLQLEVKISLGDVEGRIDHLTIDLSRKRLFIAELGKGAVGIVDLEGRQVVHTIGGLKEPQGVAYVPSTDTLFVTNAGDGSVLLFRGSDYEPAGRLDLGTDADNIRVDAAGSRALKRSNPPAAGLRRPPTVAAIGPDNFCMACFGEIAKVRPARISVTGW